MTATPYLTLGSLLLADTDANGVTWKVQRSSALWNPAPSTAQSTQNVNRDGGWSPTAYRSPTHPTVDVLIYAPTPAALRAALDSLAAATKVGTTTLTVTGASGSRFLTVKREGQPDVEYLSPTKALVGLQFLAPDPRWFGAALSQSTALPAASAAWTIPLALPAAITSTRLSGRVSLTNPGNVDAPVTVRFYGPTSGGLIGPMVTHVESGARVSLPSLVVLPGERVDVANGRALADGVAGRDGYLVDNDPLVLPPGTHAFQFEAASSGPGAQMTVESWEAWE